STAAWVVSAVGSSLALDSGGTASRRNFAEMPATAGPVYELRSSSSSLHSPLGEKSLKVKYILTGSSANPSIGGSCDTPISSGSVPSAAAYWCRSTSWLVDAAVASASSLGVASGSAFCVEPPASTMNPAAASAATRTPFRFTTITPLRYDQSLP